ncbi:MAG: protein translocase subunit SecD [Planctomycetota bacterium]|jgi:protein-export membrane protein SecD/preprotein translocase SecF subunit
MGEKNLWSKLGLIVLLVGMCTWQVYHPDEWFKADPNLRLKPGIDLGGGHSLLFEIDDSGLEAWQKRDLAERVMSVLKNRVDPQGNRNLIWRPIGNNRLEIQMPRPQKGQKEKREVYEKARGAIVGSNITETQIRTALALPPNEQKTEFDRLTGVAKSRQDLFDQLANADKKYRELNQKYSQLPSTTQPAAAPLAARIDEAFVKRNQLIEQLLETNLAFTVLNDLLELDKNSETRIKGVKEIREAHPDLVPLIDEMEKAHQDYAKQKGMLDDPTDLMRLLRGAGELEFRILATTDASNTDMIDSSKPQYNEPVSKYTEQLKKYGPHPQQGDNFQWFKIVKREEDSFKPPLIVQEYVGSKYVLAHSTDDMGLINDGTWSLKSALRRRDDIGRPAIGFELDRTGGNKFGEVTGLNIKRPLCIFLDKEAISSAIINTQIFDSGIIQGNFSEEYIWYVINTLEAGVLPARLKEVPLQQKSVGPSLGETNRLKGERAIKIAFLVTILFMLGYYLYNGAIADIALLMNLIITLGVMSFLQATFTLPGIAGLVLTLGMAVDANVLIYERIREELQMGASLKKAIKLGYEKAFSAIIDSNVTTIITAVILGSLGSEEIKGFGLTLGIGLCTSMFTALFVTRQFFHIMAPEKLDSTETGRAWLGTGILALAGGGVFGLGFVLNKANANWWTESAMVGLGKFLGVMFITAAVLMIAMWAFRIMYKTTGLQKSGRLPMMRLFKAPNINWMAKHKIFWTISAIIITLGIVLESNIEDKDDYLDIEFIGGTNVQVQVKDEYKDMTDEQLLERIVTEDATEYQTAVDWLDFAAGQIEQANITDKGNHLYLMDKPANLTLSQIQALLLPEFEDWIVKGSIIADNDKIRLQFNPDKAEESKLDIQAVRDLTQKAAQYARSASGKLRSTRIQMIEEETAAGKTRESFEVVTSETQRALVAEALLATMGDILKVTKPIEATLVKDDNNAPTGTYPITHAHNVLSEVIAGDVQEPITAFKGGVALVFENLQPPQETGAIEQRLREMRQQPDFEDVAWRTTKVIGITPAEKSADTGQGQLFKKIAIVVSDETLQYKEGEDNSKWQAEVADNERKLAQDALARTRTLQRVTQFAPQVAAEATQKAIIAIILSMIAIAAYLWLRFGSVVFGLAGIVALYHDVAITLSCVMACHHLHDTAIGQMLMLQDFRIDLAMIAAFLTIVGYSINDTIVIFDRIRENRGRLATISPQLINQSVNQTLSRTLITSLTTFMAVIVMYIVGGAGIHGFAFAMIVGTITGTYSTIAIATPMIQNPRALSFVTIILTVLTAIGMVCMIDWPPRFIWIQYTLTAIITALGLMVMIRQMGWLPARRTATA